MMQKSRSRSNGRFLKKTADFENAGSARRLTGTSKTGIFFMLNLKIRAGGTASWIKTLRDPQALLNLC